MSERRTRGRRPEDWDPEPERLAEVGYEEDGIMWLTVTPETATPEQALARFAGGSRYRMTWRVAGRRDVMVDVEDSRSHGEAMMRPAGEGDAEGGYWEIVAPEFRYGDEGPWQDLGPPPVADA